MKNYRDCQYSAFISYAGADDDDNLGWIGRFCKELDFGLRAKLRGGFKPLYQYRSNGALHGGLDEAMQKAIDASFLMVICVHEHYAASEACKKELQCFVDAFGAKGWEERFFIVSMSRKSVRDASKTEPWATLIPKKQLWVEFVMPNDPDKVVDIYGNGPPHQGMIVTPDFRAVFEPLRDKLAQSMSQEIDVVPPERPGKGYGLPVTSAPSLPPKLVFGAARPELLATVRRLAAAQDNALIVSEADLLSKLPDADQLVLAFNEAQPLMPGVPGGHLAYQSDCWLKKGRPASSVVWLRVPDIPPAEAPDEEHRRYLRERIAESVTEAEWLAKPSHLASVQNTVRIMIESNVNETHQWVVLGEQIRRRWKEIAKGVAPPLRIVDNGLPIDNLDRYPSLDDADGFILLWGKKEEPSLVSQIAQVERRILGQPGADLAPGIVAFLMPPQAKQAQPVPAWGWQILRFNADHPDEIDVVEEERCHLDGFLRRILKRVQGRMPPPGAPQPDVLQPGDRLIA